MLSTAIIIDNFNYAEFLGEAIESALAQTYPRVDVIVVDDGSTDESRKVIERYRGQICAIYKTNGGQASAFNRGFRASRNDIVIFLDADDALLPDITARVVHCFERQPSLTKVHYRLEIVDAEGRATGETIPPRGARLAHGDLTKHVLRAPDDLVYPPSSGNAYLAEALRRVAPVPEEPYRRLADVYLMNLTSLLGPVDALDEVGGRYRIHGRNHHHSGSLRLDRVRNTLLVTSETHARLAEMATSLGVASNAVRPESVTDLAQRLISLRLEPEQHPFDQDRRLRLAMRGVTAAVLRSERRVRIRALYAGWFLLMAAVPRSVARALSERLFAAWTSGVVGPLGRW